MFRNVFQCASRTALLAACMTWAMTSFATAILTTSVPGLAFSNLQSTDSQGHGDFNLGFTFGCVSGASSGSACASAIGPTVTASGGALSGESAVLQYEFIVNGPVGNTVNVEVSGGYSMSALNGAGGDVAVYAGLFNSTLTQEFFAQCTSTPCNVNSSFSFDETVTTGFDNSLMLIAAAGSFPGPNGSYDFSIDPTITILGPDANQYTLLISPDIGAAQTPEPGTLSLFGTGLAGLGWLARKRRG